MRTDTMTYNHNPFTWWGYGVQIKATADVQTIYSEQAVLCAFRPAALDKTISMESSAVYNVQGRITSRIGGCADVEVIKARG